MIRILYMYYDLMNLYGEIGNIKFLETSLKELNIKYKIDKLTINDDININDYDFIYIGSGTYENELKVVNDILKYKEDLIKYINDDKIILCTGNSLELFGKSIEDVKTLNIFKYRTRLIDKRIVGDLILTCGLFKDKVLGFQNRGSIIEDNEYLLFDEDNSYGVLYKNFYATYQLGPVLVRNPEMGEYLIKILLRNKNIKYNKLDLKLNKKAYENYFKVYYNK